MCEKLAFLKNGVWCIWAKNLFKKKATATDISSPFFSSRHEKSLIILVAQNDRLRQFDFWSNMFFCALACDILP